MGSFQKDKEKVAVNMIRPLMIGIRESRSLNGAATQMIKFTPQGIDTDNGFPERFPSAELGQEHENELVPAAKSTDPMITLVLIYGMFKIKSRY